MAAIIRNGDAEAWLLDIRIGRRAGSEAIEGEAGAFITFPTSVVVAAQTGHSVYPLHTDVEPGSFVTAGGSAEVSGVVAGLTVTGCFHWAVTDGDGEGAGDGEGPGYGELPAASYQFRRRDRLLSAPPPWAVQLPASQELPRLAPASVRMRCRQLRRRAREAEHRLLKESERMLHRDCGSPVQRALRYRPPVDEDDLVQRGLQSAYRLLPVYASGNRPPCSWLGMLRLDCRRDMHREISRLDWLPADAMAALTLAGGFHRQGISDIAATWATVVAAVEGHGRPRPRMAPAPLCAALQAPALLFHHLTAPATPDDPNDADTAAVAAVARLVSDDEELVSSVAEGDPAAVGRVGRQVVRQLSSRRDGLTAARSRCWEEFQRTGHLFAGPNGLAQFAGAAAANESRRTARGAEPAARDADSASSGRAVEQRARLMALDRRLRRVAGLYQVPVPTRRRPVPR